LVTQDFASGFFHESSSPKPLKITLGSFQIFSKIRGEIRKSRCTNGIDDTGGKFCRLYRCCRWYWWQIIGIISYFERGPRSFPSSCLRNQEKNFRGIEVIKRWAAENNKIPARIRHGQDTWMSSSKCWWTMLAVKFKFDAFISFPISASSGGLLVLH